MVTKTSRPLTLLIAAALALVAPGAAGAARPDPTGRIVVLLHRPALDPGASLRSSANRSDVAGALRSAQGLVEAERLPAPDFLPELGAIVVRRPPGLDLEALRERLLRDPRVVAVEPEYTRQLRQASNDPAFVNHDPDAPSNDFGQWNLRRQNFPAAWELSNGDGVAVGVIDSGVDASHPDFQGRIQELINHDGNLLHSDSAGVDENGHGTAVSGLACARTGNGFGIASAGHSCRILMAKINAEDISDDSVADSLVDVTNRGARVINMSFGGPGQSTLIERAIDFAFDRDVVLVASAANEDIEDQGLPANLLQPTGSAPDINAGRGLVVTAAGYDDARAGFAGRGTQISLASYGSAGSGARGIFSTYPAATTELDTGLTLPVVGTPCGCRGSLGGDDRFVYLVGTSFASPQVTGAAALVRGLNPELRAVDVIRLIKANARRSGGWEPNLGWGILDAGKAVAAARAIDREAPASRARTARRVRSRTFTVKVSGTDDIRPRLKPSGIRSFSIYRSRDGARYRFIRRTTGSRFRYRGVPGHTYRFYSRALDNAGNREAAPRLADSRTRILRRR